MANIRRIITTVTLSGERIFEANGLEFRRGFNACFFLFKTGLMRSTVFNQELLRDENKILRRDLRRTENKLKNTEAELKNLKRKYEKESKHKKEIDRLKTKMIRLEQRAIAYEHFVETNGFAKAYTKWRSSDPNSPYVLMQDVSTPCCDTTWKRKGKANYKCTNCGKDVSLFLALKWQALTEGFE